MSISQNGIDVGLVGKKFAPLPFAYTPRDTILYALGVGATADELDYLYEGRGPKVLPSFAVVPALAAMFQIVSELGLNPVMVVHGEQRVTLHRPIPAQGKVHTVSEITGIYDKGKGALVVAQAHTVDEKDAPLFSNQFSIFARGAGGFGGLRGPEAVRQDPPDGQAADFALTELTRPEQALLYRLSGDPNPLHADPLFAQAAGFARPILHGLCTFGFATRALIRAACAGDGNRIRQIEARFAAPVLPGDGLTTTGWRIREGRYVLRVSNQDGKDVLTHASADIAPA